MWFVMVVRSTTESCAKAGNHHRKNKTSNANLRLIYDGDCYDATHHKLFSIAITYHLWYTHVMNHPILEVRFFRTTAGSEPVRDFLKSFNATDRKAIGEDIKTVQFGWPLGMPLVDHIGNDIWEVRSKLDTRIVRVLFSLENGVMVLLHAFIKKQQKTPKPELDLTTERLKQLRINK